ncbi:MAG: sugar-binding transcriptional regulator [Candidatus Dormibacteria bacterium]|jgi:DNA-binding transcriptional regulator LsrR (DeoR family)
MPTWSDAPQLARSPVRGAERDIELMTRVASRYYLEGMTQEAVARSLRLSRPKVGRLLDRARRVGIVEITVNVPPELGLQVEAELVSEFGLDQVLLVNDQTDEAGQRASVARATAGLLRRRLSDGDVIALGMGRNVGAVPDFVGTPPARAVTFVSAIGGSPLVDTGVNPNEICRRLAEAFRGTAEVLYAPAYAETPEVRDAFIHHDDVRDVLGHARAASVALIGIGNARDDSAVVRMGCFSASEMRRLRDRGAVGDILGSFFDADGHGVADGIGDRVVAIGRADLERIPCVVAICSERDKGDAILGALRSGMVNALVTSLSTARNVLDLSGRSRPQGAVR